MAYLFDHTETYVSTSLNVLGDVDKLTFINYDLYESASLPFPSNWLVSQSAGISISMDFPGSPALSYWPIRELSNPFRSHGTWPNPFTVRTVSLGRAILKFLTPVNSFTLARDTFVLLSMDWILHTGSDFEILVNSTEPYDLVTYESQSYGMPFSASFSETEQFNYWSQLPAPSTGSEAPINNPPYITNIAPLTGSNITATASISFDVLDPESSFRRIIVEAAFSSSKIQEVIHNGSSFGLMYQSGTNVRSVISGGYTYTVLRDGGWPESPTITPYAIDISGSENS